MVATIEAPLALFQEPVEIVWLDAVVLTHMALRLVPEALDPFDVVVPVREQLGVIYPAVMEVGDI